MLELEVKKSSGQIDKYCFEKPSVMIGRAAANDIAIDASGVSRYHATLTVEDGKIVLQDLESTNGTYVNAKQVNKCDIGPSDKISIGEAVITVRLLADEKAQAEEEIAFLDEIKELPVERVQPAAVKVEEAKPARAEEPPKVKAVGTAEPAQAEDARVKSSDNFYWESLKSFLGPVWRYIDDDSVSEIMVNGPTEIYIESKGKLSKADAKFTEDALQAAVLNIAQYVGRRVDEQEPYLDARLPDGSRVAVLLPPCSRKGTSVAIRKFSKEKLTMERLIEFGSLTRGMVDFIRACVILRKNVIISGGTSSGKTSLLNVVSGLIPSDERILTIEDSAELQLSQEHVVPMETKPPDKKGRGQVSIRDLVRASLRMRPDRIVVGEIRGGEALDLLQAMNTGHSGSMATLHASSPRQALSRLETLALFSGLEIPVRALREQVTSAVEYVVQAARLPDHSRKVTHISEVDGLNEDGSYKVKDIFRFQRTGVKEGKIVGEHLWTGSLPGIMEELEMASLTEALELFRK